MWSILFFQTTVRMLYQWWNILYYNPKIKEMWKYSFGFICFIINCFYSFLCVVDNKIMYFYQNTSLLAEGFPLRPSLLERILCNLENETKGYGEKFLAFVWFSSVGLVFQKVFATFYSMYLMEDWNPWTLRVPTPSAYTYGIKCVVE